MAIMYLLDSMMCCLFPYKCVVDVHWTHNIFTVVEHHAWHFVGLAAATFVIILAWWLLVHDETEGFTTWFERSFGELQACFNSENASNALQFKNYKSMKNVTTETKPVAMSFEDGWLVLRIQNGWENISFDCPQTTGGANPTKILEKKPQNSTYSEPELDGGGENALSPTQTEPFGNHPIDDISSGVELPTLEQNGGTSSNKETKCRHNTYDTPPAMICRKSPETYDVITCPVVNGEIQRNISLEALIKNFKKVRQNIRHDCVK